MARGSPFFFQAGEKSVFSVEIGQVNSVLVNIDSGTELCVNQKKKDR